MIFRFLINKVFLLGIDLYIYILWFVFIVFYGPKSAFLKVKKQ